MDIGQKIKMIRTEKLMTQKELAGGVITRNMLSQIENGIANPSLSTVQYIADKLGLEAYGVSADLNKYAGQSMRDFREVLARCKDWAMCFFKPEPTYLGESIPVNIELVPRF